MQRKERLRGKAEFIGDSEPDAAVADIERENAGRSLHEDKCTETDAARSLSNTSMVQQRRRVQPAHGLLKRVNSTLSCIFEP